MFCVLGVVLQTILDVYNCFTCIVSLYRNDPTPRKIGRWLVFQTLYIYVFLYGTLNLNNWKNKFKYKILKSRNLRMKLCGIDWKEYQFALMLICLFGLFCFVFMFLFLVPICFNCLFQIQSTAANCRAGARLNTYL